MDYSDWVNNQNYSETLWGTLDLLSPSSIEKIELINNCCNT